MASVLVAVKGAKSFLGETEPSIDNWTFRLFYKVTIVLLNGTEMT